MVDKYKKVWLKKMIAMNIENINGYEKQKFTNESHFSIK